MPIEQILTLALVQGITEFLPISSSGHLVLVPMLTGWDDQGVLMDVAVHVGTLFAVMIYFWRDVAMLVSGLGHLLRGRATQEARILLLLVLATLPILAAGFIAQRSGFVDSVRTIEVIAWANLGFAMVLWMSDSFGMTIRRLEHTGTLDALLIGLAQICALVPGASRAGVTMTMARFLGYERTDAARLSMLLSIPTIIAAGTLAVVRLSEVEDVTVQSDAGLAAFLAFASALISIWFMMALLRRASMLAFVLYRIVLGVVLLAIVYGFIAIPAAS